MEPEVSLAGGRVTTGVVRVGDTVRRPAGSHSPFVHELLRLLEGRGFEHAARFHGVDADGREILDFFEGWVPPNLEGRAWRDDQIAAAARIVRGLHDATAGSTLTGSQPVVCHGDLSPCNFVFVDGRPRFLIDFDRSRPGTRQGDLAYMAWAWLVGVENDAITPPLEARLTQLRDLLDAYGLEERVGFAAAIVNSVMCLPSMS